MADNKEKLVEQEKEKLAEERQKIDTFADFGNMYNFKKDFTYSYKTDAGLTEDIVREISEKKHEPEWMLNFRLKSLDIFNHMDYPDWGPDISELDMDNIVTYVRPNAQMKADWNDVPDDIKDTFDRLGIPEAERHPSPASAPSTTRKSSITASRTNWSSRASSTPTSIRPLKNMKTSSRPTS